MDRRAFIGGLAAIATMPRVARAQLPRKVYRIGILSLSAASDVAGPTPQSPSTRALLRGLNELGYVYGRDFVIEIRGGEGKPELSHPRPCGPGLRPEPGTPRRKFHRVQPSVARDGREATRATQGSCPRFGATSGAMGSAQHHRSASGPSRRRGAGVEGARGRLQNGRWGASWLAPRVCGGHPFSARPAGRGPVRQEPAAVDVRTPRVCRGQSVLGRADQVIE